MGGNGKRNGYRTFPEYQRLRGINWSLLRAMQDSPAHFRYRKTHERADSPAMALGRAIHTAVLEPDRFLVEFSYYDGPRRAGEVWEKFAAANAGRTILKPDEYEKVLDVRDAIRAHKVARRLLRWGRPEVTLQWTDPETRLRLKARPDWLGAGGVLLDLKSTRDIEMRSFSRLAVRMSYIEQLAFYRLGKRACGYEDGPAYLLAVEVEGPHDVGVFEVEADALDTGEDTVRELLQRVKDYRHFKYPPGRYPGVETLDVPPWFFDAENEAIQIIEGTRPS
jgi:hypothetical protein